MKFDQLQSLLLENMNDSPPTEECTVRKDYDFFTDIYEIMSKSYMEETGTAMPEPMFRSKAKAWDFYGTGRGFVAVRHQNSGFSKLVATAGDMKGQYCGMKLILSENLPVWGFVSAKIAGLLKKMGFKAPNILERMMLRKLITQSVLGDATIEGETSDGGIIINYPALGKHTKYFVGSPAYFKKLYAMPNFKELYAKYKNGGQQNPQNG